MPQFTTQKTRVYAPKIVRAYPHDRAAFTQGLVFSDNGFFESTGLNGRSSVRRVKIETGVVLKKTAIPNQHFGEGLALLGDKLYMLTWQTRAGFIFEAGTLKKVGEFRYDGEGWGLTTDGKHLIHSDGTPNLRFFDPRGYKLVRSLKVTFNGEPVPELNELEWVNGEIWANVWQTDVIVRIDPKSGNVTGRIDCSGLLPAGERAADTDVLNGIAHDPKTGRLFLTGKLWPKVYEVRLVEKQ